MRPEDIEDAAVLGDAGDGTTFEAEIDIREDMGSEVFLHFALDAKPVVTEDVRDAAEAEAVEAAEAQAEVRGHQLVARVARESRLHEGDPARLAVRTDRLHFFDLDSGTAIS
jgi:multiple sugar transport system ATP-binding protein